MSENVISVGCMAKLKNPVGSYKEDMWEDFSDMLYEHNLILNYDGNIVFTDTHCNSYDFSFKFIDDNMKNEFIKTCSENGIDIDIENVKIYVSQWYNGTDSYMSDITLEQFNKGLY